MSAQNTSNRLAGKVAIISGGAGGLGSAIARSYVDAGARVVIGDNAEDRGKALAEDLGAAAIFAPLDVTSPASWADVVATAERTFGPVTTLVSAAGVMIVAPIAQSTVDQMRLTYEVNVLGTFHGVQAVLDSMTRAGSGSIITFSSIAGVEGSAGLTAYSTSKAAVIALTKTIAMELGGLGIRANAFAPGQINTPMSHQEAFDGFDRDAWCAKLPLQREGQPEDISPLAVLLASDDSSYMTGMVFNVDGGMTAGHGAL